MSRRLKTTLEKAIEEYTRAQAYTGPGISNQVDVDDEAGASEGLVDGDDRPPWLPGFYFPETFVERSFDDVPEDRDPPYPRPLTNTERHVRQLPSAGVIERLGAWFAKHGHPTISYDGYSVVDVIVTEHCDPESGHCWEETDYVTTKHRRWVLGWSIGF